MDFIIKGKLKKQVTVILVMVIFGVLALFTGCDVNVDNDEDTSDYTIAYYRDADGDGYGDSNPLTPYVRALPSSPPVGYINNSLDCNDADASINPDATETPGDTIDSNCDGNDDT